MHSNPHLYDLLRTEHFILLRNVARTIHLTDGIDVGTRSPSAGGCVRLTSPAPRAQIERSAR